MKALLALLLASWRPRTPALRASARVRPLLRDEGDELVQRLRESGL
jgi:hypothetical protein